MQQYEFNPELHESYKALVVKQPYAQAIAEGIKTIEVRSRRTKYRGKVLICSSKSPVYPNMMSGCTLAIADIAGQKPISEFTQDDWNNTRIPIEKRKTISKGWGWILDNIERVVELPCSGRLGIFNIYFDKGDIIPYPKHIILDKINE